MEAIFTIFFLAFAVVMVAGIFLWTASSKPYDKGKAALAAGDEIKKTLRLKYALVDPSERVVGLRPESKTIVIKCKERDVCELAYDALRTVTLTPVSSSYSETTGETRTRRGSQLIGAGVGAVLAGPLGAVVGGLTGSQQQQANTTTLSSVDDLELELFFRDDDLPRFIMHAGSPDGMGGHVMIHEVGEGFKDMAARLANIVDARATA